MNRVDFIDWLHTEIDAVLYGEQSKEQLLLKAIPMVDLMLQKCEQAHVSGSLPSPEQSKKAMLRRKTKFVDNMDKFSSRKNAYKEGWRDCYNWIMQQGNDR